MDTKGLELRNPKSLQMYVQLLESLIKVGDLKKDSNVANCISILNEAFNISKNKQVK